jgi:hypothetical protein
MTIMTDEDRAEILAAFEEIIEDRPATITLRRKETELDPQTVRIARTRSSAYFRGEGSKESRGGIIVCGAPDMDIKLDDRFTLEGSVYRIRFVRPNRDAGTQAETELVQ